MKTVVFDIETVALPWLELDQGVRDWVTKGAAGGAEYRKKKDWRTLSPYTSKAVTIAMMNPGSGQGKVWFESSGRGSTHSADGLFELTGTDEKTMLEEFWRDLARFQRYVTYNGRAFDGPFLTIRSAIHGVAPTKNLTGKRFSVDEHVDLLEVLTFFGAASPKPNLHTACTAFGIPSPKSAQMHGYAVGPAYEEGRMHDILEYCRRDVEATAELFRRVEATILPLFPR